MNNEEERYSGYTISNIGDPAPVEDCIIDNIYNPSREPCVDGDIRLEAGIGADQDGDIYFTASGKTLSLGNLLEIIQAIGYDHFIDGEKDQEVHCDYESARSVLQHG